MDISENPDRTLFEDCVKSLVKQLTKQSTESLSSKTIFWTEIEINVLEPGPVFNTVSLKQYSLPHRSNSSACFPGYSGVNCNCAVELKTCWNRITKRLEAEKKTGSCWCVWTEELLLYL
ncbi:hypothetical protein Adt_36485 [Abeliophyllum distichum]|uniref:Uncharacterized protein n=1 Tax=Abeliophyllum distichum TaxID=126358 RepID=A0ABD1QLB9_9LAMI